MTGLGIELGMRIQELRNGRNMKQAEFMRNMKNDLYERALEKKDIKYYY